MLNSIIGHEKVKIQLDTILQRKEYNRTYMFYGPSCSGKRTTAFDYAKTILCDTLTGDDCNCRSCSMFVRDHPDFLCIGRDERIKVADVDRVLDFSEVAPFLSNSKVVVIDNADSITWEASNRLLKILEEPPKMFTYILVTSDPNSILNTVRSRCIRVEFNALSQMDMVNVIMSRMGFEPVKARLLGWIGHGSSVDIFARAGKYLKYRDIAVDFVSGMKNRGLIDSMDFIDKVGKNDMDVFVDMVILVMTDVALLSNKIENIINLDLRDDLKKIGSNLNAKAFVGAVGWFSQVKKDQYLNINLSHAMKTALIKSRPLILVEQPS